MRSGVAEMLVGFGLRAFGLAALSLMLLFGLGVVLLGPQGAFSLRIGPTLLVGALLLIAFTLTYSRWGSKFIWHCTYHRRIIILLLCAGVVGRIAFALLVHPKAQSDFLVYWQSAEDLVKSHEYTVLEKAAGREYLLRAYRPPGTSFLVALAIMGVGKNIAAPLLVNLTCFSLTVLCVTDWCRKLLSAAAAYWAAALLVFWPTDVMMAGFAQSESPVILATALLLWLTLVMRAHLWVWSASVGVVIGLSCLVRNSNLIVVVVVIAGILRIEQTWTKRIFASLIVVLCVFAVLLPWSLRNYRLLHAWDLVATNGGENFYVANNSGGSATWDKSTDEDIRQRLPDEVLMNRIGFARGKDWIAHHPASFLKNSILKFRILVENDDHGPYWAIERGRDYHGPWLSSAHIVADLWWILLWMFALQTLFRFRIWKDDPRLLFILELAAIPTALFLVFLSAARYHAPMVPAIVCLAAFAIPPQKSSNPESYPSEHGIHPTLP